MEENNDTEQTHEIDLREKLDEEDEVGTIDEAFKRVNFEAAEKGYKFVKGSTNRQAGLCYFYCKYRFKNPQGSQQSQGQSTRNCMAYYSYRMLPNGHCILAKYHLSHNHPGMDNQDLTEAMKRDLQFIPSWANLADIVDFFETKYGVKGLNYQKVYYHFRKAKPLFGMKDCENFVKYLSEQQFSFHYNVDATDQSLCKILFVSPVMKQNYKDFGDIVLIDATYQTNIYKAPLVLFTGIGVDGKNLLFGMAFINNESFGTYEWLLQQFFQIHEKKPSIVVTDGDLAICSVMDSYSTEFNHFICQWHLLRNFKRNCGFLKRNHQKLFELLMTLPYIKQTNLFDESVRQLDDFFASNENYKKSQKYLHTLCKTKEKWADCYKPQVFTAGSNTTSRAESMNRVIKRYVNDKGEISAILEVIKELDDSFAFVDPLISFPQIPLKKYQLDPLMVNIKEELGELIYKKHYHQYYESTHYSCRESSKEDLNEISFGKTYQVRRDKLDDDKETEHTLTVQVTEFACSCHLFKLDGILCKHMFCVARVLQIKDLSGYLHPRWKIKNYSEAKKHENLQEEINLIKQTENAQRKLEDDDQKAIKFKETLNSARKIAPKKKISNDSNDKEKGEVEINLPLIKNFRKGIRTKGKKKESIKRKDPPNVDAFKELHRLKKGPPN